MKKTVSFTLSDNLGFSSPKSAFPIEDSLFCLSLICKQSAMNIHGGFCSEYCGIPIRTKF